METCQKAFEVCWPDDGLNKNVVVGMKKMDPFKDIQEVKQAGLVDGYRSVALKAPQGTLSMT